MDEVLRVFGVPSLFANKEGATSSFGGIQSIIASLYRIGLMPHKRRWDAELNRKLLTPEERNDGVFLELDTSMILREAPAERYETHRKAIGGGKSPGWRSVNEIRLEEGMPKIDDPRFDAPYYPDQEGQNENQNPPRAGDPE